MPKVETLQVSTPSETEIAITRVFDAPRALVFRAFTEPALLKRWLLGPDGWELAECDVDLRVGGRYRYVWYKAKTGVRMGVSGAFREVVVPERYVATERFDDAWYPGEAVGTLVLTEAGGRTTLTQTMAYESRAARDVALQSGMNEGLSVSYDRLAAVLAALPGER
jgi:uncharacterized protein YndB with AHSA1/START domain